MVLATHDATGVPVAIKYLDRALCSPTTVSCATSGPRRGCSPRSTTRHGRALYEYVEATAGAAIVMELVDGVTLRAMLRERGPTEPEAALVVLKGSLLGLGRGARPRRRAPRLQAGERARRPDGHTKLADFGIATRARARGHGRRHTRLHGPRAVGRGGATPQSDIYAATATFFECLTGRPPFDAAGDLALLRRQHEHAPVPADDVPEAVRDLLRQGLAKDPSLRPADAATFLLALESAATLGYGPDWESSGRAKLARRASMLALLLPLGAAPAGGTAIASTVLGAGSRLRTVLFAGAAAIIIVGGGISSYTAFDPTGTREASPPPSVVTTVTPSPTPVVASPTAPPSTAPPTTPPATTRPPDPPKPPKLTATVGSGTIDCAMAQFPQVTLRNTGGKTLTWNATISPEWFTLDPSSGTIAPGKSVALTLAGQFAPGETVTLTITSNGGDKTVNIVCPM